MCCRGEVHTECQVRGKVGGILVSWSGQYCEKVNGRYAAGLGEDKSCDVGQYVDSKQQAMQKICSRLGLGTERHCVEVHGMSAVQGKGVKLDSGSM